MKNNDKKSKALTEYNEQSDNQGEEFNILPSEPSGRESSVKSSSNSSIQHFLIQPLEKRQKLACYIELKPAFGMLNGNLHSFNSQNKEPNDLTSLSGMYAYCIAQQQYVKDTHAIEEKDTHAIIKKQYLLLLQLKNSDSNHGFLNMLSSKLPDYTTETTKIIAGGEIIFDKGKIIEWNLKSAGFSKNTSFDESNTNFAQNKLSLWLPNDKYKSIASCKNWCRHFSESGSPIGRKNQSSVTIISPKS